MPVRIIGQNDVFTVTNYNIGSQSYARMNFSLPDVGFLTICFWYKESNGNNYPYSAYFSVLIPDGENKLIHLYQQRLFCARNLTRIAAKLKKIEAFVFDQSGVQ